MLMETDSEALMHAGTELATRTWGRLLEELSWRAEDVDRVICHQIGAAHRKNLLGALGLGLDMDYPTFQRLGNMGSVSLPLTFDQAEQAGHLPPGLRVALLGIGSGLHCCMLGVET